MKMPQILLKEYTQVKKALELMSEREMKKGPECNEVLAFKFHYLGYILSEIHRCSYVVFFNEFCARCLLVCAESIRICFCRTSQNQTDPFETFVKKILKGSRGEEYLELLLRDCVREFPYRDGFLFQQVLRGWRLVLFETNKPSVFSSFFPLFYKILVRNSNYF